MQLRENNDSISITYFDTPMDMLEGMSEILGQKEWKVSCKDTPPSISSIWFSIIVPNLIFSGRKNLIIKWIFIKP